MSQWSFVIAAYALTAIATVGLLGRSYASMRRAEADADALKRQQ